MGASQDVAIVKEIIVVRLWMKVEGLLALLILFRKTALHLIEDERDN